MPVKALVMTLACAGMLLCAPGSVNGQHFPDKPVRIVINGEPGGGGDFMARLIAPGLGSGLGQPMVIDNRPSGVIAGQIVAKAPATGYTLLVSTNVHWLMSFMRDNMPYDPVRHFSTVALTNQAPNILVVHPSLPARSVKELISLAAARPGELNYASATSGSSSQIAAELFKAMAGVNIVRVPYKGNGPGLIALMGGQVQLMFATAGSVTAHVKAGSLRALAITSMQTSALFPGLPTVAAAGLPGYESQSMTGIWAPAGTPAATVARLNQEIVRTLERPEVQEKLHAAGIEVVASTPAQFQARIQSDMARMGKVIKDAGIRDN